MRIVFMGTPDFAVYSLTALHQSSHEILAVVTVPDKHQGRGKKVLPSAVKIEAESLGYTVLQPETFTDPEFIAKLEEYEPELIVVVAFKKLPETVFTIPVFGTVNVHASLLPKYRGAAPINHALLNGETETGVSTFYITEEIDAGTILLQEKCDILDSDNFESLYTKLAILGADLIVKTLDQLDTEGISFKVQDPTQVTDAPKIKPDMLKIDWSKSGMQIINHIRAFSPRPGAFTTIQGQKLKITQAKFEASNHSNQNFGEVVSVEKKFIKIAVQDGFILPLECQLEGKKRMDIVSFLNGNKLEIGTQLK